MSTPAISHNFEMSFLSEMCDIYITIDFSSAHVLLHILTFALGLPPHNSQDVIVPNYRQAMSSYYCLFIIIL